MTRMPDDELIELAREAAIPSHPGQEDHIRSGKADDWITVRSALRALKASRLTELQADALSLEYMRTLAQEHGYPGILEAFEGLAELKEDRERLFSALAWAEDHEPWLVEQIRERAALSTQTDVSGGGE